MSLQESGTRSTHKGRGGRSVLGLIKPEQPHINALLGGGELLEHSGNGGELQRWAAALWNERNRWDINRRATGFVGDRRLSKAEAGNMLAKYRRDGRE